MPKNKTKGKSKQRGRRGPETIKRELQHKEDGQEYAKVVKMLGDGRCECYCLDGLSRVGHIRGSMRKKVWITTGDLVLVSKRDFQEDKVDIVHKYTAEEARKLGNLLSDGETPQTDDDIAAIMIADEEDIGIDFDDV